MNTTEAVLLLRKVRAYRPAMVLDEYTGDAWAEALDDVRFEDADRAVRSIARRTSDWIDPAMIRLEVRRTRDRLVEEGRSKLDPPPFTTVDAYHAWIREACRRLGDGETPEAINASNSRGELKPRDMRGITAGRRLTDGDAA